MSATFAIDLGLPKVRLGDGTELWLGLQAMAAFKDGEGRDKTTWLPMPFWGFGRRVGSGAIKILRDKTGRRGIGAQDLLDRMRLDGAEDSHLDEVLAASLGLVGHGRRLADALPSPLQESYVAQLEGFVAGVESEAGVIAA